MASEGVSQNASIFGTFCKKMKNYFNNIKGKVRTILTKKKIVQSVSSLLFEKTRHPLQTAASDNANRRQTVIVYIVIFNIDKNALR